MAPLRRRAARRPRPDVRLLLPADGVRPVRHLDERGARGVVRAGAHRGDVPRPRTRRSRSRTTASTAWPARCGPRTPARRERVAGAAADGHGLDQRLPPLRPAGGVGRLQAVRASAASSAARGSTSTARPSTSGTTSARPRSAGSAAEEGWRMSGCTGRLRHRRRRLGRAARWPTGSAPTRAPRARAGGRPPGLPWDVFIHMPAALPFPIGNRFYDWKYESEPEPYMNGRRIYHARGKVLGGSSSINGMIFQRGNPLDYERWAADPGMEHLGLRALPAVLQADGDLPGRRRRPFRGGSGPLVLERGPATNPLFGAFFEAVQQAGYPLTDDVNGYRQEGFARVRPQRPPRPAAQCRPRLPAPGDEPAEPRRAAPARWPPGSCSRATARSASSTPRRGRQHDASRAGEVILCGGAINSPAAAAALRRRQRRRPARGSASPWSPTCPASARTSRTTSRSTSSTPARSRCRCARPASGATGRGSARSGCSCAAGRAPPTTSRRAASSAATTTSTTRT